MKKLALLLVAVVVAGFVGDRTVAEFSSATDNPGNSFTAASTFGSTTGVAATVAKTTAGTTSYSAAVLADSPTAYWRLGEASGAATLADSSPNGRHGTYSTPELGQAGAVGDGDTAARVGAVALSGQVPHAAAINLNGSFSVELWLKVDSLQSDLYYDRVVMAKGTDDSVNSWRIIYTRGRGVSFFRFGGYSTALFSLAPGRFNHVVFSYDGSVLRSYVDGVSSASNTLTFSTNNGTADLRFGPNVFSAGETATVDDVALYGSALTAAQVRAHYDAGRMLAADPCAQFRFYANITSGGSPVTGVTSATADLSAVVSGQTAAPLTAGSYTVGGTTYAYRSAALRPTVAPGTYGASVTWVAGGVTRTQTGLGAVVAPSVSVKPSWVTGFIPNIADVPNLFSSAVLDAAPFDSISRGDLLSLRVTKDSNTSEYAARTGFTATTSLTFAVRLATLPTADVTSLAYFNTSATPLYLGYQVSSQKLTLRWGANAPAVALSTVSAATWYALDFKVDTSANPNTATWRIEGVDQPGVNLAAAAQTVTDFRLGSATAADRYTANYDDAVQTQSLADYPLGPASVRYRSPNGVGTHVGLVSDFQNSDGTAITATVADRLRNVFSSPSTGVRQVTASSSYLELAVADAIHVCIRGVSAVVGIYKTGSQASHLRTVVVSGTEEMVVHDGDATGNGSISARAAILSPMSSPWSQSEFNSLLVRIGYATDISPTPYWNGMMFEYYTMT